MGWFSSALITKQYNTVCVISSKKKIIKKKETVWFAWKCSHEFLICLNSKKKLDPKSPVESADMWQRLGHDEFML